MSSYEFTGKSVKEAIERACEELKIDEAMLEIEVLEESSKGFLGIVGHREARVRVKRRDILKEVMEVEPILSPPPEDKASETHEKAPGYQPESESPDSTERQEPSVDPALYVDTARDVSAEHIGTRACRC